MGVVSNIGMHTPCTSMPKGKSMIEPIGKRERIMKNAQGPIKPALESHTSNMGLYLVIGS